MKKSTVTPTPLVTLGTLALAGWAASRLLRDHYDFHNKVVLLTGGSRGLGLAMGERLIAEGARVAILARDAAELARAEADLLAHAAGGEVLTLQADVTRPEELREAVEETVRRFGALDVLINNAGIIQVGPLENMELADFEAAMATNYWGPLHLVRAALPHLRRRPGARILNIASIGGEVALPHMAPYNASKHALVGLSETLRVELDRDGVRVTTVTPGVLRTGSHVHAEFKGQHAEEFNWFAISAASPLSAMGNARAARQILEACRAGQPYLTVGLPAKLMRVANGVFPNLTAHAAALVNRLLLPAPGQGADANHARPGRESRSAGRTPPAAVARADRATERYNGGRPGANGHG